MNLNKAIFVGNLTANPELIHTPKGTAVVNASLAVNEFYTGEDGERQQITTFIDVKVWGPAAENFAKLAKKGQEILIDGSIRQDTWEDKESGQKRSKLYVRADSWQFTQRKAATPEAPAAASSSEAKPKARKGK
jgi:single-strand DNA-binding protein